MKKKIVSAIITCYNGEKWISGALESVLNQTYGNIEIIVVNDGSRDGSREVILKYLSGGRIIYVEKENGGVASARNRGMDRASGEYICVLDQDDLWLPDKTSKQVAFLENNKQIGAVYSGVKRIDGNGISLGIREFAHPLEGDLFRHFLKMGMAVPIISVMIRREFFEKIGRFDEALFGKDDWDLLLRLARETKFGFIPDILVKQRFRPGTAGQSEPMYLDNFYLVGKYKALWPDSGDLVEEFERKAHYVYGSFLLASGREIEAREHFIAVLKKNIFSLKALVKLILSYARKNKYIRNNRKP